MKKKLLKLFLAYSYVTLICLCGSRNFLAKAKARSYERETGKKAKVTCEWYWKETLRNWKEGWKLWGLGA